MIYIVCILAAVVIFLLAHLLYIKMEVRNITRQLVDISKNSIDKKVAIGLVNREIEELTQKINDVITQKKACEASKVKLKNELKQTIANMSHDLRTPLTSIKGYIQFLKLDNISEDEKKEYLSIAEKRVKTLEVLLNDFYELSLVDSMDCQLNLEKINISRVLEEIILGRYSELKSNNLNPRIEIPKENIFVMAEKKSLERIVENLLSNVIRYAKDDASIFLKQEGSSVLLQVSNRVKDLTHEDVDKIFDRFYMADKTRSGNGTGLGLSITKALVEKMHGSITADMTSNVLNVYCRFQAINS